MSNYYTNAESRTNSTVKLVGIFLLSPLFVGVTNFVDETKNYKQAQNTYQLDQVSKTYGQYTDLATGNILEKVDNHVDVFEEKLASFYEKLTYSQEELGAEFSKVLFDNLWDLYEV
ncbi:MAG: hypothetical protein KBD64_08435 [Gammaproteobacteria bacterium]|nr:hypothetical protein [Gammaproteobacteria bacterium]